MSTPSLMHNPFTGRDEVIFIDYEEIIRSPYPAMLKLISSHYQDHYKDFLWMEEFADMDMPNLERLCVQRTKKNIFEFLAKKPFDYDQAIKDLKDKFMDIYKESPMLMMGESVSRMMSQKFTKKIYMYTEQYDIRVHIDIQETFKNMNIINYVTGDIEQVIQDLKDVSFYVLKDIDHIPLIFKHDIGDYKEIVLASYGYNYNLDDNGEAQYKIDIEALMKEYVFKFASFQPVELTPDHFTMIIEG